MSQSLDTACIKLASVISDISGKSGMYLLNCVLEGRDIDEIIDGIPSGRLKKKADQIKESIKSRLEISQVILIRGSLNLMRSIQERIDELDGEISASIQHRKNDLAIASPFLGQVLSLPLPFWRKLASISILKSQSSLPHGVALFLLYISQPKRLSSEG